MHTTIQQPSSYTWSYDRHGVDWLELSELYRLAPLGDKAPRDLEIVFGNSRYAVFISAAGRLVGVGRALGDGLDCAYIGDVAVHPAHQGHGLGSAIVDELVTMCGGHKKIVLYASPGTESFYDRLGFLPMRTAMAIFRDPERAIASGVLDAAR